KLHHKKLDAIVLNHPAAIGAKRSRLEVLQRGRPWQILPETTKARQALQLIRLVENLLRSG
ncbi:MAG: hypothetical protein ABIG44_13235, partial [Planctomycetota bacterium]